MDVLKFFNVGEKVCIGMTGRKVFTIIGIQNTLPMFGGGRHSSYPPENNHGKYPRTISGKHRSNRS